MTTTWKAAPTAISSSAAAGKDHLQGGGGDLLIGGFTALDANRAALFAILAEWTSGRDYETRVANLRGKGSGPRLNADFFLKTQGSRRTVFDDDAKDELEGDSGRDWFFARLGGKKKDKIGDLIDSELIDELG